MRTVASFLLMLACLALPACGDGGSRRNIGPSPDPSDLPPLPPPDGQGRPGPAPGAKRAGTSYDVTLTAADGNAIAFTVHEPLEMAGGQPYPLLIHGHGFGGSRVNASARNSMQPAGTPLGDTSSTVHYTDAGYGVISFDQRGFGDSGGDASIMDPDKDGPNLIQIVDWAESNLDWLEYRDANLLLGTYGGSYGGGYQLLLNNIDPRRRLDAMAPSVTWHDLSYSLNSGDVPKSGYGLALSAAAQGNLAPEVNAALTNGATTGRLTEDDKAYLRYHSNRYFCDGVTQAGRRAATPPPRVDALFMQGMADTLFNFNEGEANFDCLRESGGDVRLYSYLVGHVLPSGSTMLPDLSPAFADYYRCGPFVADALAKLWFDAKIKRDPTAIAELSAAPEICINLGTTGEGVVVNAVSIGGGPSMVVPVTQVPELVDAPRTVPLMAATETTVVAGIPTATLTLSHPAPVPGQPGDLPLGVSSDDAIVFVAFGLARGGAPTAALETVGDQIRPLRGFGTHALELNGIGVKLQTGDQLHLILAGQAPTQYPGTFARNPLLPTVNVSGTVQLPILGNVPTID